MSARTPPVRAWTRARALAALLFVAALGVAGDASATPPPPGRPPSTAPGRPAPAPLVRPSTAPAEAPVSGPVSIEILCVRATNSNSTVDASLRSMMPHFKMLSFTGYSLVDSHEDDVAVGDSTAFTLEGGRKVKIELVSRDATAARLRIQLTNPQGNQLVDTTVSIKRDRSFVVAGPKLGDDVLILPITVNY